MGEAYSQSILMTVDNDTIYTSDFEKNQRKGLELLGVKQTINNYIDFSLLKQYALKHGIKNTPAYQSELVRKGEKLKDSLYYPTEILEPLLQDYYKKITTEKKFQLLVFNDNILPENEKKREKFVNSVIKEINNTPSKFEKAVKKYSSVSYFAEPDFLDVFSLDKAVVDAIYETPLNKVIYRVLNGMDCLILVSGERKYLGEVVLDEIFIQDTLETSKVKIEKAYKELQQGRKFSEIKNSYLQNNGISQDEGFYTKIQNDDMYDYVSKEININTANHEVSQPILLENGYAIYKYLFRESYDTYALARKKVYTRLKESQQVTKLNDILIEELKEYPFFKENSQEITQFIHSLPATYDKFQNMNFSKETVLVDIGETFLLTNKMLLEQMKKLSKEEYPNIGILTRDVVSEWENTALLDYYKVHFYELNRIKDSWNDLVDQLLIKFAFTIIAHQAQNDIEGQKEFLKTEASKLTWEERIQGTFYYCLNRDVEKEVVQMLKDKRSVDHIKEYFKGKTDPDKNELVVISQGKSTRESLNLPVNEKLSEKIYAVDYKNLRLVVNIESIVKNDTMSLEELQSTYIDEYIDYKTTQIIKQLKKEAVVNINQEQEKILEEKYR
jgi:hypothetical protein